MRTKPAEHTTLTDVRAAGRTLLHYAAVSDCRRELSTAAGRRQIPQSDVRINNLNGLDNSLLSTIMSACQHVSKASHH